MEKIVSVRELIPGMNVEGLEYVFGDKAGERWDRVANPRYDLGTNNPHNSIHFHFMFDQHKFEKLAQLRPFENQALVDLGAGDASMTTAYKIAEAGGARAYVAVDLFADEIRALELRGLSEERKIPCALVEEDMLSFLQRLLPRSVSLVCSAIDWNIIKYPYAHQVGDEVKRVFHPDGAYLTTEHTIVQPFKEGPENFRLGVLRLYSPKLARLMRTQAPH